MCNRRGASIENRQFFLSLLFHFLILSIFPRLCKSWSHFKCQGIDEDDLNLLKKSTMGYVCVQCRTNDDGSMDFLMGIERLMQVYLICKLSGDAKYDEIDSSVRILMTERPQIIWVGPNEFKLSKSVLMGTHSLKSWLSKNKHDPVKHNCEPRHEKPTFCISEAVQRLCFRYLYSRF